MSKAIKTVILCGGKGTRMKEETEYRPKPLVEVGGRPIVWHIMKLYAHQGFRDFVLALGYKGGMIKNYFLNHKALANDFTLAVAKNETKFHGGSGDNFNITFADTGSESLTGERLRRIKKYIGNETFMLTYGDGVANIDIKKLLAFHKKQKTIATITGVHPSSKYGLVRMDEKKNLVTEFYQKPMLHDYMNGGFMVLEPKIFDYLSEGPLENVFFKLIAGKQLSLYKHEGFWKAVDTYLELEELNKLWDEGRPWAVWEK